MKIFNSAFNNAITAESQTLAWCWYIKFPNGNYLRYTSLDHDLEVAGEVYHSERGLTPSASQGAAQEISGVGSVPPLDYARVVVFVVDYLNPPTTLHHTRLFYVSSSVISDVTVTDKQFKANLSGLDRLLEKNVNEATSKTCRVKFGSPRCGVNRALYRRTSEILEVKKPRRVLLLDSVTTDYIYGTLSFAGVEREIASVVGNVVTLYEVFPLVLEVEDVVTLTEGCKKTLRNCLRFNNTLNFQGEPFVPTRDEQFEPGERRA